MFYRGIARKGVDYYLNYKGNVSQQLTFVKSEQPGLRERIFFSLSLDKVPFIFGVIKGELYFSGHRLLEVNTNNYDYLKTFTRYKPGLFCYSEMIASEPEQWQIDEQYYTVKQNLLLDIKVFFYCLIQNLF